MLAWEDALLCYDSTYKEHRDKPLSNPEELYQSGLVFLYDWCIRCCHQPITNSHISIIPEDNQ